MTFGSEHIYNSIFSLLQAVIWSVGIAAVEMANGEPPDANLVELLCTNSSITPQFLNGNFSEEFEDFVASCLKPDPDEVAQVQN